MDGSQGRELRQGYLTSYTDIQGEHCFFLARKRGERHEGVHTVSRLEIKMSLLSKEMYRSTRLVPGRRDLHNWFGWTEARYGEDNIYAASWVEEEEGDKMPLSESRSKIGWKIQKATLSILAFRVPKVRLLAKRAEDLTNTLTDIGKEKKLSGFRSRTLPEEK